MLRKEEVRLIVNLDDLRDYNREYADGCVLMPELRASGAVLMSSLDRPARFQSSAAADLLLTRV